MKSLSSISRTWRGWAAATGLSLALLQLGGCAGLTVDENDPASLMADAEADIGADRYQVAIDKLRVIRNKFPYSKFALEAQLRIADVYFLQESFTEAAAAYEAFRDLHPRHERVEYAMFRVGESHFRDLPTTVARDLNAGVQALSAFDDYLRRFPKGAEATLARGRVAEIRGKLAEKELYVGEFYWKRSSPAAARPRYEKVIALYPDTDAAKTAQRRLDAIAEAEAKSGGKAGK